MEKGDKVRVIKLDPIDIGIIELGSTGVIAKEYRLSNSKYSNEFYIKLDDLEGRIDANELNADGTYCMNRYQLEVIGKEE